MNELSSEKYGVYFMHHNNYLDQCIAIVYKASSVEIKENGLTSENILILIKTSPPAEIKGKDYNIRDILINSLDSNKPLILRVGSECVLGIYGDSHCDCESQRIASLNAIQMNGQGIYVHMPQEAQGRGLHYKAQELSLQVTGHDPVGKYIGEQSITSASKFLLGHDKLDIRSYKILNQIFSDLGLNKFEYLIISNNPNKIADMSDKLGIKISKSLNVSKDVTPDNIGEYLGKLYSRNQSIDQNEFERICAILEHKHGVPERVYIQLAYLKNDYERGRVFNLKSDDLKRLISFAPESVPILDNILSSEKDLREDNNPRIDLHASVKSEGTEMGYIGDEETFSMLSSVLGNKYIDYLAFENKKYYDIVSEGSLREIGRQIKVRRTENIVGMDVPATERLIYKIENGSNNQLQTVNVSLDNRKDLTQSLLLPMYSQTGEHESISHVCKLNPNLILVVKVLPHFEYLIDISGSIEEVSGLAAKIDALHSFKRVDISSFEEGYGKITKFSKESRDFVSKRERELAKNYLKTPAKPIFKIFEFLTGNAKYQR